MPSSIFVIGDANLDRFWPESQLARPQLVGVPFKHVSCLDTLGSALSDLNDSFEYALISVLTSMLIEEGSAADVSGSSFNITRDVVKLVRSAAKRAPKLEVMRSNLAWIVL